MSTRSSIKRVQTAINVANEIQQKMDGAVERHAERMGVEIEPRSLGEPNKVKMVSVRGVTSKMIDLAKASDKAVIACNMAMSVDAVPYEAARDAVGSMIGHNRLVLAAVKKMREFVVRRVGGEKIHVNDLVVDMTQSVEKSVQAKAINFGVATEDGKPRKAFEVEEIRESLGDEELDKELREWKARNRGEEKPAAEAHPKPPSSLRKILQGGGK